VQPSSAPTIRSPVAATCAWKPDGSLVCDHAEAPADDQLSTAGRLRAAGFVLLATFDRPHHDIALPDLSDGIIMRLEACFDAPIPNPGKGSVAVT
jgi:hypothetical protein